MRILQFDEQIIKKILGRTITYFQQDFINSEIQDMISNSSFLVIGGAGSIGSETVKEIFRNKPRILHVVDINENNLAELVREIRSSIGYIKGEFKTFVIDAGSYIFEKFFNDFGQYDFVLNFSALKHVRSEKDPYTLMRMIEVNILNTIKTLDLSLLKNVKKYFCVSTDKATNPVNMMGASKRIMELFLLKYSEKLNISTARFANVAFSDGSLLFSFIQRVFKKQPIVIPDKVKRYFITPKESAILCLLSGMVGKNREIFFPKFTSLNDLHDFFELACRFLNYMGYEPYLCQSEDEARQLAPGLIKYRKWACYISPTDTTGEKEFEEFYSEKDQIDLDRFAEVGVIKMNYDYDPQSLTKFVGQVNYLRNERNWTKRQLVEIFKELIPEFEHDEKGKYLDEKM